MQRVVNMVKEEQDKNNKKIVMMREAYEKKLKAYEDTHYKLGCSNSDLKARLELYDPQLKELQKKIALFEKQVKQLGDEIVTSARREAESRSEAEMYKSMCSSLKAQINTQETLVREAQKRQTEIRRDYEAQVKEEQKRARGLDDRIL